MTDYNINTDGVTKNEIVAGLKRAGVMQGQVILVHSAMRTFGCVKDGAETVVDALLEGVGKDGTLVVPTFTFYHEIENDPLIDPVNDRSDVGAVSESARKRPDSRRSIAFRHSVAAIGRWAKEITDVNPALSPFDIRSSFGAMLALDTQVLLIGMAYSTSSTTHHFAEWLCNVPYRHIIEKEVKIRKPDGTVIKQTVLDYQPRPSDNGSYYGDRHADFNALGRILEKKGLVGITAIGNAVVRRFAMRDLTDIAKAEASRDYNIFRTPPGKPDFITPLDFGRIVISPQLKDGAGRANNYQWSVMEPEKILLPESTVVQTFTVT